MNDNDAPEGSEVNFQLGRRDDGTIIIAFAKPVSWIGMPPHQAVDFAEKLLRYARPQ